MDEAYFGGPGENPKRGRGTNKTPVLVAMALTPQGKPKHLKMKAVKTVDGEVLKDFVEHSLDLIFDSLAVDNWAVGI